MLKPRCTPPHGLASVISKGLCCSRFHSTNYKQVVRTQIYTQDIYECTERPSHDTDSSWPFGVYSVYHKSTYLRSRYLVYEVGTNYCCSVYATTTVCCIISYIGKCEMIARIPGTSHREKHKTPVVLHMIYHTKYTIVV